MRHGDLEVTDWEVTEVEVNGQPAVRLDMWVQGTQKTIHLEREGDTLHPWTQDEFSGMVGLVDSEGILADRILEREGYELADTGWE
jgi:hypothetical protein